jgi:hypothetical protein
MLVFTHMILSSRRLARLASALFFLVAIILYALPSMGAYAAQLTVRSLTLQAGATDGGSKPSGVVKHLFGFTVATTNNVGSIEFLYCKTAAGSCTTPAGLDTTTATLTNQTGATGFTIVNTTNGAPYITRTAASISSGQAVTYQFSSVTNPDNTNCFGGTTPQSNNCPFYVRISTFAATNATGSPVDTGTVAASTATQITVTGTMPESLIFCTGATISTTSSIPDCSTATTGAITFNQLFSPADTATATSQLAASTNAGAGYVITVNGVTLTSGGNTVTAMTTNSNGDLGVKGTRQFGLNLKANTTTTSNPAVGTEVAPAANGTNYKGQALTGYNTADRFRFVSGESVADSANGGAGPTDSQIYTASYIANVSGGQPTGTYTSTLTYICTATF